VDDTKRLFGKIFAHAKQLLCFLIGEIHDLVEHTAIIIVYFAKHCNENPESIGNPLDFSEI